MTKEELIETIQRILSTNADLKFLLLLDQQELETLLACIRAGICTLKLARFLDKDGVIPQYSLQYLRYYLDLKVEATAHDASGDILVLERLFKRIYARFKKDGFQDPTEEMLRISNSPILIARMPFGKHKGLPFKEISADYLEWLLGTELDEDMEHTVRHHLGKS